MYHFFFLMSIENDVGASSVIFGMLERERRSSSSTPTPTPTPTYREGFSFSNGYNIDLGYVTFISPLKSGNKFEVGIEGRAQVLNLQVRSRTEYDLFVEKWGGCRRLHHSRIQ